MNRDTVVGIVGSAILVAAMVGVFWYERSVAPVGDAAPTDAGGDPATPPSPVAGTVALGETATTLVNVSSANATVRNVTFQLTWSATNGRDTLKLTVAPPPGSGILEGAISEPTDSGDVSVTVQVPEGATAVGVWEVKVEFVRADPDPLPGGVPPPTPPPNSTDESVAYSVATTLG